MKLIFRTLAIVMAALLAVSMVGCGGDDGEPEVPDAAFVSSTPADGGSLASNSSISVTFDNNPGDVTVSAGTATTSGKTRTIAPPEGGFAVGALALTISWTNGDGEKTLNFTVTAADEDAPEVESSDPEHGDTGVSADLEEVSVTFNEVVTGDLMLMDGDDDKNWDQSIAGATITLTRIAGEELGNETTYTISGTVMDASGNETEVEIEFTTEAKE